MDKGTFANLCSTVILALSLALPEGLAKGLLFSAGIFAFSGGITNSLAVKMLFDRIPGLVGSGVIPARFQEIRREIKRLIMQHFFDEGHLRTFLREHREELDWSRYVEFPEGQSPIQVFIEKNWDRLASREAIQPVISSQVEKLMDSSVGGFLHIVGKKNVEEVVSGFVDSFAGEMRSRVLEAGSSFDLGPESLDLAVNEESLITDIREKVEDLLEQKLEQLDARQVKRMMEDVIRDHLGWLVVWGNVFGGLIGILAYFIAT